MAQQVKSLRFEVSTPRATHMNQGTEFHRLDVNQFLSKLKAGVDSERPKFKITKVALEKKWDLLHNFTCVATCEGKPKIEPVFPLEFDGFKLSSTKNSEKAVFARAFGKEDTLVFIWDKESKTFIREEELQSLETKSEANSLAHSQASLHSSQKSLKKLKISPTRSDSDNTASTNATKLKSSQKGAVAEENTSAKASSIGTGFLSKKSASVLKELPPPSHTTSRRQRDAMNIEETKSQAQTQAQGQGEVLLPPEKLHDLDGLSRPSSANQAMIDYIQQLKRHLAEQEENNKRQEENNKRHLAEKEEWQKKLEQSQKSLEQNQELFKEFQRVLKFLAPEKIEEIENFHLKKDELEKENIQLKEENKALQVKVKDLEGETEQVKLIVEREKKNGELLSKEISDLKESLEVEKEFRKEAEERNVKPKDVKPLTCEKTIDVGVGESPSPSPNLESENQKEVKFSAEEEAYFEAEHLKNQAIVEGLLKEDKLRKEMEAELNAVKEENGNLKAEVNALKQEKELLEGSTMSLSRRLLAESTNLDDKKKDLKQKVSKERELNSKISELEEDLRDVKRDLSDERRYCKKLEEKLKKNWLKGAQLNGIISSLGESENDCFRLGTTDAFTMLTLYFKDKDKAFLKSGLLKGETDLKKDFVLMPINYSDEHWALLLWKRAENKLFYFDSLGWRVSSVFNKIKGSKEACSMLLGMRGGDVKALTIDVKVPRQSNGEDCGPLVLVMMEKLIQDHGKLMKELTPESSSSLLKDWFDPDIEALLMRRKVKALLSRPE
jgi:hypothetical protein